MNETVFPDHIFKAYDVRGVYPTELDEDLAQRTGKAFTTFLQKEEDKTNLTFVVAMDMRLSSPNLKKELIKGIRAMGAKVIDIHLSSTPMFYFAVAHLSADGGIIVSASHNPKEYNGLKMVRKHAIPISYETGIYDVRDLVKENKFNTKHNDNWGTYTKKVNIINDYLDHELKYAKKENQKDFKKMIDALKEITVVCDPANSMGATYLSALFERIPASLIKMNFELDGCFPAHQADPLVEENLSDLKQQVRKNHADLGIATDGDGDRLFLVDNLGETVPSHILRGLLAKIFLRNHPKSPICYDIRPGRITRDMIEEYGGTPVVTRVGHSLIKEKMREVNAVFAGESSGHYFYRFDHGSYEAPVLMIVLLLLELIKERKQEGKNTLSFSDLIKPYKKYVHSGEINSKVDDKQKVIDRIIQTYDDANKKSFLDGVTIEYDDFWFNIRPSNTEPLLRLNLEAITQEIMEEKRDEVLALISS
ncbi:MAG: phosphomannomutase/phosphoglucomutase [Candidatus Thermoplasmatota archaeon]|nr:phosphomannomutase/phosphoglucomutase [Candidatus Thermoplasmatota archaeon]